MKLVSKIKGNRMFLNRKDLFISVFFISLFILYVRNSYGMPDPSSLYCYNLGYKETTEEELDNPSSIKYFCSFPDDTKCDSWDFMKGECGNQWSYCSQLGYEYKNGKCIFSDDSKCDDFSFMYGLCGEKWNFCAISGGKQEKIKREDSCTRDKEGHIRCKGGGPFQKYNCILSDGRTCTHLELFRGMCD